MNPEDVSQFVFHGNQLSFSGTFCSNFVCMTCLWIAPFPKVRNPPVGMSMVVFMDLMGCVGVSLEDCPWKALGRVSCAIEVAQKPFQCSPVVLIWVLHSSCEECNSSLNVSMNVVGDVEELDNRLMKHGCFGFGKEFFAFGPYFEKVVVSRGCRHSHNLFRQGIDDICDGFIHRNLHLAFGAAVKTHA